MNISKIAKLISLSLILIILFCGCDSVTKLLDDTEVRIRTEAMLDALILDDVDAGYSLVSDQISQDGFCNAFSEMQNCLDDVTSYDLKLLSINKKQSITDGQTASSTSAVYELKFNSDKMIVSVKTVGDHYLFEAFYLTPYTQTDYYHTGTLMNMDDASFVQWLLLLSNLLSIGITIYALVDCFRSKINKKLLWILFLILGFVTIGLSFAGTGFRINLNFGWLAYSALVRYGSGMVVVRLMVPVGAVCYLINRRKILNIKPTDQIENGEVEQHDLEGSNNG